MKVLYSCTQWLEYDVKYLMIYLPEDFKENQIMFFNSGDISYFGDDGVIQIDIEKGIIVRDDVYMNSYEGDKKISVEIMVGDDFCARLLDVRDLTIAEQQTGFVWSFIPRSSCESIVLEIDADSDKILNWHVKDVQIEKFLSNFDE